MVDIPPEAKALPDPPTDGISCLSYLSLSSSSKSLLASTSWDGCLRIHDTAAVTAVAAEGLTSPSSSSSSSLCLQLIQQMQSGPLLSLTTTTALQTRNHGVVVTGGMDGSIRIVDLETSASSAFSSSSSSSSTLADAQIIGCHSTTTTSTTNQSIACNCLGSLPASSVIASAGWHRKFHLWDLRMSHAVTTGTQRHPSKAVCTLDLPGKAFSMDVDSTSNRIVIGTSGRRICFLDVRKSTSMEALSQDQDAALTATIVLDRESSLKYQTRVVRLFHPDGDAIAVGSVEGRVAVEYMEELGLEPKGKKYAFKCHRLGDIVYPVNCIEFHPRFGTFATGGCDGQVVLWDGLNKKKLTTLQHFPTSIAAMAFSHDGKELAIASSYTFEEGEREHPRDEIYVRPMLDVECMPKSK